ncbi:hypothetical protein ATCC90586_004545 [Pythium insidiosum]|nr:hypothetical protein ATCC90586_004545 [Pythium insidiosum]
MLDDNHGPPRRPPSHPHSSSLSSQPPRGQDAASSFAVDDDGLQELLDMFDTTHVLMGMPDQDHHGQSQAHQLPPPSADALPTLPLDLYPHPHPHPLSSASTASSTPSSTSDHFISATAAMFPSPSISFSSSDDASEDDKKKPTLLALAPPPPSSNSSSPLTDSSDMAKQQRVERQRAERRNAELKGTLEDQLKVARSLEKVLLKRPTATNLNFLYQTVENMLVEEATRLSQLRRR